MAYYLTMYKNREFLPIDITSLEDFERLSKLKNGCSLEEIDKFTSKYKNEKEFRIDMYRAGLLDIDDINRTISIRKKYDGKLENVMYGLVYQSESKYFKEDYLLYTLLSKQNDLEFLRKFASHYRNSYINNENISRIRDYAKYQNGSIYNTLRDFFIREIYSFDKKTGEMKLKYKSLHDLAMFVYNYDNINNQEIINIDELDNNDKKEIIPIKTRKRVRKEVEGQLTFNDML